MLNVIYKNIDDLIPYVNNSRIHSDENAVPKIINEKYKKLFHA